MTKARYSAGTALALLIALAVPTIASAQAASAESAEPQAAEETTGEIVVSGRRISQADEAVGQDRITSTVAVTREALLSAPSGISGLKMLESLPGFNVQTDGALGLYEFGNSV